MGVFTGCCIALELGTSLNFKKKQEIRKLITENDGIISFIITKKCNFLVTTDGAERAKDSFKCRTAVKFNIPVVSVDFLYDSVANSRLSDPEAFYVIGETKKQLLTRGVISLSKPSSATVKAKKQFQLNWNAVKSWTDGSNDAPDFHNLETFEVARSVVLQKPHKTEFCVVELHVATGNKSTTTDYESGIVMHVIDTSHPAKARKEYRCGKTLEEGIAIYSRLHQIHTEPPHGYVRAQKPYPPNIGSAKFQKAQLSVAMETVTAIDSAVLGLVDVIWTEATGRLDDVLAVAVNNIKVEQVEKAESVLLEIKQLLDSDSNGGNRDNAAKQRIVELSDEFYSHLPHNNEHRTTIDNKKDIASKQRLCQLVLDVVSVSESTGWSQRCSALAKYRALRCHVTRVSPDTTEYDDIVGRAHSERMDRIVNIFHVSRPIEDIEFRAEVDNHQLMCHASQVENFVGILSRGLLLPKVVVDDLGGKRTDPGMLGHGIYFADSPSTSVGYSHPSRCKGTRLMALCEIALGCSYETTQHDLSLTAPPAGYDSVHGVGASGGITSEFKDDEFVVYSTDRQRLRYLVEFTVPGDSPVDRPLDLTAQSTDLEQPPEESVKEQVSLSDVKDAKSPLDEVKAGLVSNTDAAVPLRSVHVRAKLVDLAAQVVVLQEYHNDSHLPIEAKFVFPLDEMSVVCGFEAFINGKHVVGVVKEKETAHREYKQAVEAGHGAYLMDQDKEQPDVFTVSVGNLPAYCTAVIKITYVAELLMDGEFISFRVPGSVAPWTERSAMDIQTQSITKTVGAGSFSAMTIQVSVEMPFDIRTIHSPTHRLRIKKTDTRAVVEMANNQSITDGGFQLLILLAELHVPRMWVEQHPDNTDSRACMLAFYPEFETSQSTAAESSPEFEAIFFIDLSNSMKDMAVSDAKKVLLLALHHLPSTCTFNIVRFGTDYDELFPCSRQKTDDNVTLATDYVNSSSATLGNTDVYRPLHTYHLLSRLICSADECRLPVNVFIVSDGHLSNAEQTFHAARSNAQHTRIFTLGVGDAANRHALRSLAHVGGGSFEFFDRKFKSKWEGRVKGQLTKAAQPSLSSIEVEWQTFSDDNSSSAKLVQAPASIMALFSGCRQVVYGFVPNCNQATLKAVINNQQVSTVVSTSDLSVTTGNMLHQLTARAVIHDWQQGLLSDDCLQQQITKKNTKNYIIKLSIDYSIVTEFTSFVAIETRDKDEVIDVTSSGEVLKLIQQNSVDALDYMGWQVEEKSELELTGERLRNGDYAKLTKELVENYMESVEEFSSNCDPRQLQGYIDVYHWAKATQQPELKDEQMLEHFKEQYDEIIDQLDTLSEESYTATAALLSELKDIMEELHIPESTSSESSSVDFEDVGEDFAVCGDKCEDYRGCCLSDSESELEDCNDGIGVCLEASDNYSAACGGGLSDFDGFSSSDGDRLYDVFPQKPPVCDWKLRTDKVAAKSTPRFAFKESVALGIKLESEDKEFGGVLPKPIEDITVWPKHTTGDNVDLCADVDDADDLGFGFFFSPPKQLMKEVTQDDDDDDIGFGLFNDLPDLAKYLPLKISEEALPDEDEDFGFSFFDTTPDLSDYSIDQPILCQSAILPAVKLGVVAEKIALKGTKALDRDIEGLQNLVSTKGRPCFQTHRPYDLYGSSSSLASARYSRSKPRSCNETIPSDEFSDELIVESTTKFEMKKLMHIDSFQAADFMLYASCEHSLGLDHLDKSPLMSSKESRMFSPSETEASGCDFRCYGNGINVASAAVADRIPVASSCPVDTSAEVEQSDSKMLCQNTKQQRKLARKNAKLNRLFKSAYKDVIDEEIQDPEMKLSPVRLKMVFQQLKQSDIAGEAYWEMNICHLICADYARCCSVLLGSGVKSLGEIAVRDVTRLLATLMVLFRVFDWSRATFTNIFVVSLLHALAAGNHLDNSGVPDEFHHDVINATRYCIHIDSKRPLVYSTLQLGHSWIDVVFDFLDDKKVKQTDHSHPHSNHL